jgi:hypothetical protein
MYLVQGIRCIGTVKDTTYDNMGMNTGTVPYYRGSTPQGSDVSTQTQVGTQISEGSDVRAHKSLSEIHIHQI